MQSLASSFLFLRAFFPFRVFTHIVVRFDEQQFSSYFFFYFVWPLLRMHKYIRDKIQKQNQSDKISCEISWKFSLVINCKIVI